MADRPDELWLADITYASTWEGWLQVSSILTDGRQGRAPIYEDPTAYRKPAEYRETGRIHAGIFDASGRRRL